MKLRYIADLRSIAFVLIYFGLVSYQWLAAPSAWWFAVPLFVVTCFFSFFGAVITHNTVHSPVFEQRWMNRIFQVVLSLTYGSAVSSFVPGHNLSHHKHVQSNRDVMRTSKVRSRSNLVNMVFFAPLVALAIMKGDRLYAQAMKERHRSWFVQFQVENFVVWGSTVGLFLIDWRKALLYWFIPHIYAAWGIISINYLQHDGCDVIHPYNHSRNFVGRFVNFWTFNNGFHGIHHDNPSLHWSLLPEAHARLIAPHIDPRLDQKSLFVFIVKTFVWPGRRVTFDGKAVILPPVAQDEAWVPRPEETPEDLGAIAVG